MITREEILSFRLSRWNELPDLGLYMDQVLSVVEKNLSVLSLIDDSKFLTSTMINNYVKQKIMEPPKNKKYYRYHLARLTVVCVFKRFLNLTEIYDGITMMIQAYPSEVIYNTVCDEIESALQRVFGEGDVTVTEVTSSDPLLLLVRRGAQAFANVLYAHWTIGQYHEKCESELREIREQQKAEKSEKKRRESEEKKNEKARDTVPNPDESISRAE